MREGVTLSKQKVKVGEKQYVYYQLRWFGADGKRRSESIGRVDEMSLRQANKLRSAKEQELKSNPAKRNIGRAPSLKDFIETYLAARKPELANGSWVLQEQTGRYLKQFFGEDRRIDEIARYDARQFKTALSDGKLKDANKKKTASIKPITVDVHMRNARTIFNRAVDDDLIEYNPFDRLTGGLKPIEKNWHYVTLDEFKKLIDKCPNLAWKTLLALCRFAGLRRGEALRLRWGDVDFDANRLSVWAPKTARRRIVPIAPELLPYLNDAFKVAAEGVVQIVGDLGTKDIHRQFAEIVEEAGTTAYSKPFHTLRKNRENDWIAAGFPFHVVVEWMGHSPEVARQHYLRVNDSDIDAAATTPVPVQEKKNKNSGDVTQIVTQNADSEAISDEPEKETPSQVDDSQGLSDEAGDATRTRNIQLGRLNVDVRGIHPDGFKQDQIDQLDDRRATGHVQQIFPVGQQLRLKQNVRLFQLLNHRLSQAGSLLVSTMNRRQDRRGRNQHRRKFTAQISRQRLDDRQRYRIADRHVPRSRR